MIRLRKILYNDVNIKHFLNDMNNYDMEIEISVFLRNLKNMMITIKIKLEKEFVFGYAEAFIG